MPQTVESLIKEAREIEATSTVADALAVLRAGSKQFPKNDQLEFAMANLLEKAKNWTQALNLYQQISTRHEKMPPDVALGLARAAHDLALQFDVKRSASPHAHRIGPGGAGACGRLQAQGPRQRRGRSRLDAMVQRQQHQ